MEIPSLSHIRRNPFAAPCGVSAVAACLLALTALALASTACAADLRVVGSTHFGQFGQGEMNYVSSPVELGEEAVAVSVGYSHVLYIDPEGQLWGFGDNTRGQLGDGTFSYRKDPVLIDDDVAQAHAGYAASFYVKSDGQLFAMGNPGNGVWGGAGQAVTSTPRRLLSAGVQKAMLGEEHAVYLMANGDLRGTGIGAYLGAPTTQVMLSAILVGTGVSDVGLSNSGIFYTTSDGSLYGVGYLIPGGSGDFTRNDQPSLIATNVSAFATGEDVVLFVTESGELYALGISEYGALGLGREATTVAEPTLVATGVADVETDGETSFFIDTEGRLFGFGLNLYGQLGDQSFRDRFTPVEVASGIQSVSTRRSTTMFVGSDGGMSGSGNIALLQMDPFETARWPVRVTGGVARVFVGEQTIFFVNDEGQLWGVGRNDKGQLGTGEFGHQSTPQLIAENVMDMEPGATHSAYVTANGDLFVTGNNDESQFGGGDSEIATPVKIADTVQDVELGANSTLWIDSAEQSLWLVADPDNSELFHESEDVQIPFPIAENVIDVGADRAVFYVTSDNRLWARGASMVERLTRPGAREPQDNGTILVDTEVTNVKSSGDYAIYRKSDGTLWGIGVFRGLGDLADPVYADPVMIDENVTKFAAGHSGFLYQTTDGAVWMRAETSGAAERLGLQSDLFSQGQSHQVWPDAVIHDFAINEFNTALVVDPVAAPVISDVSASRSETMVGEGVILSVSPGVGAANVRWYEGPVGDRSRPLPVDGLLTWTAYPYVDTEYWAEVSNEAGDAAMTQSLSIAVQNPDYGQWATARGLSRSRGHHLRDADGDGIVNALEYAFGTHPLIREEVAPDLEYEAGTNVFRIFHPIDSDAEVTLLYEVSSDLQSWQPIEEGRIQSLLNNDGVRVIQYAAHEVEDSRFVRIGLAGME